MPMDCGNVSTSYDEFNSTLTAIWTIPDYNYIDDSINSTSFGSTDIITSDTYPYRWHLTVHPNGSRRPFQGFVSIYLYSDNCGLEDHVPATSVKIKMSISRSYDGMKSSYEQSHHCKRFDSISGGFGFHHFIHRSYLLDSENHFLTPDGALEIVVKVTHLKVEYPEAEDGHFGNGSFLRIDQYRDKRDLDLPSLCELSEDMALAFETDDQHCDVAFMLEGKVLKASKAILAARSPVFRAMFSSGMKEDECNEIVIEDVQYDVMKALLRFIYSGTINEDVEDNTDFVIRLFSASDKYQLKHLKKLCETYICSNITTDCVALAMISAHLHSSKPIKVTCFNFLATKNIKEVEDWAEVHQYQSLIDEMLTFWHEQRFMLTMKP